MAQIKNKLDIKNSMADEFSTCLKSLPNFFNSSDEMATSAAISLSLLVHVFIILMMFLLSVLGIKFPCFSMPELPERDIEFKLVQQESKPPINKNTKIRSDRDSQAGGKHDPKKAISDPTPKGPKTAKPATAVKQAPVKQQVQKQPPVKQQVQQTPKEPQKPVQQQPKQQVKQPEVKKPAPAKPSAVKAPSTSLKPSAVAKPQGVAKPSTPKIAPVPKSAFAIPTQSGAGSTYKPAGAPTPGGGSSAGSAKTAGVPAPKFSSSGASSGKSGSAGSKSSGSQGSYSSRGTQGGGGTGGNPSPGNPNGAPGIDAIKQPNWGPYMRDLEQRIKRNWTPPKADSSKRVVVTFTISRDGRLLSKKVTKSSGVPLADRAAVSAIEQTAPFRPFPPEYRGSSVSINFTFDYNVLSSEIR